MDNVNIKNFENILSSSFNLEEDFVLVEKDNPVLRSVCSPVTVFDDDFARRCEKLKQAMIDFGGIGLAAPQVGWSQRVIALLDLQTKEPFIWVNPEITKASGWQFVEEGCLSLPGRSVRKMRSNVVELKGFDEYGVNKTDIKKKLAAACVQHEIDHINGVLMID